MSALTIYKRIYRFFGFAHLGVMFLFFIYLVLLLFLESSENSEPNEGIEHLIFFYQKGAILVTIISVMLPHNPSWLINIFRRSPKESKKTHQDILDDNLVKEAAITLESETRANYYMNSGGSHFLPNVILLIALALLGGFIENGEATSLGLFMYCPFGHLFVGTKMLV